MAYYAHVRNGIIEGVGTCFAVALDMDNIEVKIYTQNILLIKIFLWLLKKGKSKKIQITLL